MTKKQTADLWSLDEEQALHDTLFPLKEEDVSDYSLLRKKAIEDFALRYNRSENVVERKVSYLGF